MADNKNHDSDTLSQQRKSREEFLKLKRMQSGEVSPPPPPSAEAQMPATVSEKVRSYWYYYRWFVLVATLITIIIVVGIAQCATRTKYDMSILLLTRQTVSEADNDKIAEYFEQCCDDINGDGEVHVQVYNCSYDEYGNPQVAQAKLQKFVSLVNSEENAVMFILDKKSEDHLLDVFKNSKLFDTSVMLGSEFYEFCDTDDLLTIPKDLKLIKRYYRDQSDEQLSNLLNSADKILLKNNK